ncbi:MAG: type III secretion protein V [Bradymonadia bacterium]
MYLTQQGDIVGLKGFKLSKYARGDVVFAGIVVAVVALLIVPLPTPVLDILLTANISFAVVLLLTALYVKSPLQISTFPSILLVATLFRLALNVSSTRLILGEGYAGDVIESFGEFVVKGNYVVGAVVFLILTIIQFLVIAKGSERVAEVAARFTLDAMPGKQMSIDADLRAGAFTLAEARRRRGELQKESQLFGALDGAMKFVKGDAIAGIIITIINVVGGLIIGIAQLGMSAADAAATYTLLTVGDGLVSQIPALVVSLAAGLVVTRVGGDGETDLGTEIVEQLTGIPKVFGIAAVLLLALGLTPGLPLVPFAVLGTLSAVVARFSALKIEAAERDAAEAEAVVSTPSGSKEPIQVQAVTPLLVEMGIGLSSALRSSGGDDALKDQIKIVRDAMFKRLGVRVPSVRVRFGVANIGANDVRVLVYEAPEAQGTIAVDRVVVNAPPDSLTPQGISGELARHPLTRGAMTLVTPEEGARLQAAGMSVLSLAEHVMLYLGAAAHKSADRFVGLAEVQLSLDQLEPTSGALIDAVVPRPLSLAVLTGVLKRLVGEGVSIRDLRAILEALAEEASEEDDVIALAEMARVGLGRATLNRIAPTGHLRAVLVDHSIEQAVRDAIRREPGRRPSLSLPPRVTSEIIEAFREPMAQRPQAVVVSQDIRRYLRQLLALEYGPTTVLGLSELHDGIRLESVGTAQVGG